MNLKRLYFSIIIAFFFLVLSIPVIAQNDTKNGIQDASRFYSKNASTLTLQDSMSLFSIQELTLPKSYRNGFRYLPWVVDNSTSPFLRWIYYQSALECGQAAGIAYTFTFEINRMRNIASDHISRQYPTHFAWNFKNGGTNKGVCAMETWDVIRTAGTPTVEEWGGTPSYGGEKRWASGYDLYYSAMKNRIYEVFSIPVGNPEGLQILKYWLHDHLDGSSTGGLAVFYSSYISNGYTFPVLPAGTPEAGEKVITAYSSYVNHAQTIVGFNDSIRYDYNGDGVYTNNIDINGDGIVNMQDWEIGGLKFTNSFGTDFANNGFCYMTYKTLAEPLANGGIWNNTVYVIKVREEVNPKATFKVSIKHPARGRIKVSAGVSTNLTDVTPQFSKEFSVFNYQGGDYYMTGSLDEIGKTLEFGLDVSSLLNYIEPNIPVKFFLKVEENAPDSVYNGEILSFSVINYSDDANPVETIHPQTNVPINTNGVTYMSLNSTMDFSKPEITDDVLPSAQAFENYSHQLTAVNGSSPYFWEVDYNYQYQIENYVFPMISQQLLTPSQNDYGYVVKDLPFTFSFYGKEYNQIVIYVDGYIGFNYSLISWPFPINNDLMFKSQILIAPFYSDLIINSIHGIWFESSSNHVGIRWKAAVKSQSSSEVNFALKIYENGEIEFFYGNIQMNANTAWKCAISRGDAKEIMFPSISNSFSTNTTEQKLKFTSQNFPEDIHLSTAGVISGVVTHPYDNKLLQVKVIDNNDIISKKTVSISSAFDNRIVVSDHSVLAGDDDKIDAGEEVKLTVSVTNIDSAAVTNARIIASSADPFISFTDNEEYFGYIGSGNTYTLNNAFRFNVSGNVPNEHPILIDFDIECDGFPSHTQITLIAYSVDISIQNVIVLDGNNNALNASETDTIRVILQSTGGSILYNIYANISTTELGIEMIKSADTIASLSPGQPVQLDFIIQTQSSFVENRMNDFVFNMNTPSDFEFTEVFSLYSGNIIEDFETADFTKFPWTFNEHPWTIVTDSVYQGGFSSRSGLITHDENSDMSLTINALVPGFVRFYKKTSCEYNASATNWDYLVFYLNDIEKGRWDGQFDWSESFYPIAAGENTLKFSYKKDYSVNAYSDAVWVDNILLPVIGSSNNSYDIAPDSIVLTMNRNEIQEVPLYIYNTAQSLLMYRMELKDPNMYNLHWLTAHYAQGSLNGFEMDVASMSFDSHFLQAGIYHGNIILTFNNANVEYIPICLTVISGQDIAENQSNINLKIFPNPATDIVHIRSESSKEIQKVEVYSIQGKLIKSIENINSNLIQMDVSEVNSGIYLVKIESNNQFAIQRLIITH